MDIGLLIWRWMVLALLGPLALLAGPLVATAESLKPRVVVLTDVSTWETDDSESLVRLLVHADLLEIEGLVFTTGWSLDATRDDFLGLIQDAVNAYEKDLPNLRKRSSQEGHVVDESRQPVGYWPSPQSLRDRTVVGSRRRGAAHVGAGNDSPGSKLIIDLADEDDQRPLWITIWGGGNTLAQAIWRVQQDRTPAELKAFLGKLRVYAITDQDRDQKTPFEESSHQWMRREFERDLLFVWDESAWKYQNGTGRKNWAEYESHIQGHGHLGQVYPKYKYGVEGDTPAFLHLLPIGLNDPQIPTQGGWGGYFAWGQGEDRVTKCYTNWQDPDASTCRQLMEHFYPATFANFAARMDWAKDGAGNRNPVVVIDGDRSLNVILKTATQGTDVTVDAAGTYDPDGDQLSFQWWVIDAAGTFKGPVEILNDQTEKATIRVPSEASGYTFHLICEVADDGLHQLRGYRRIIFQATE
ncbi:MAG: DUF1593 domain-containing protein [Pirellulales bacterium]